MSGLKSILEARGSSAKAKINGEIQSSQAYLFIIERDVIYVGV